MSENSNVSFSTLALPFFNAFCLKCYLSSRCLAHCFYCVLWGSSVEAMVFVASHVWWSAWLSHRLARVLFHYAFCGGFVVVLVAAPLVLSSTVSKQREVKEYSLVEVLESNVVSPAQGLCWTGALGSGEAQQTPFHVSFVHDEQKLAEL